MKHKLIIIFSFFVSFCFAQKTNNDLENKISLIETKYLRNIDSLQRELLFFKMKEDHYTTALEVQAGHYEHTTFWGITIATLLLGLAGLIGFSWFWSKYNKMKQRLSDLEETIQNDFEKEKSKMRSKFKSLSNAQFITFAMYFSDNANGAWNKEEYHSAYYLILMSASSLKSMNENQKYNERIYNALDLSLTFLKYIKIDVQHKEIIIKSYALLNGIIENSIKNNNELIKNKALSVLAKHQEISNKLENLENNTSQ